MKKQLALALVFLTLCCALAACRRAETPGTTAGTSGGSSNLTGMSLSAIVDAIYAQHPMELPLGTIDVELTDHYAVKSYLGLDSSEKISEAVASESMLGAQAYSLVLCRVKNAADAPAVARQMRDGIDQRKWVCVHADDLMASAWPISCSGGPWRKAAAKSCGLRHPLSRGRCCWAFLSIATFSSAALTIFLVLPYPFCGWLCPLASAFTPSSV